MTTPAPHFSRRILLCGVALAFAAVVLGAFGAHGLASVLNQRGTSHIWETATRYQMWHALALLLLALTPLPGRMRLAASICFAAGIAFFSGSLYWLAMGGPHWLGPVTPLGGLLFLAGWICLAIAAVTGPKKS